MEEKIKELEEEVSDLQKEIENLREEKRDIIDLIRQALSDAKRYE